MDRLQERLDLAAEALGALEELTSKPGTVHTDLERDAILLRFMLATEATWKAAQRFLQERHELEVGSPKESVRVSLEVGLLDDERAERALALLKDRNLVVHTYNEPLAREILSRIGEHARVLKAWLAAMRQA